MRKLTLILTFLLFAGLTASAQMQITGTVTNSETGEPIPGVSIVVQSQTTIGTTTDMDGQYSLEVPSDAETLVFSFVGMQTREVSINGRTTIDVEMQPSVQEMEEVVVMGYNEVRKSQITGSSVQVDNEQIEDIPVEDVTRSLQGEVAGVNIRTNSGTPGAMQDIRIRGQGSINASNQPLIVIDGVPVNTGNQNLSGAYTSLSKLSALNSGDIESFTVLKDASATAAYGARGSNGVIVIETKDGQENQPVQFNLKTSYGFQNNAVDGHDFLSGEQRFTLYKEAIHNTFGVEEENAWDVAKGNDLVGVGQFQQWIDNGRPEISWKEAVKNENAPLASVNLSARGGTDVSSFYASLGYNGSEATVVGAEFERISGMINYTRDFRENLTFDTKLNIVNTKQNPIIEQAAYYSNPHSAPHFMPNVYEPRNEDGTPNIDIPPLVYNPLYLVKHDINYNEMSNFNGYTNLNWAITDNLNFETRLSGDYSVTNTFGFGNRNYGDYVDQNGNVSDELARTFNFVIQNRLNYTFSLQESHNFDFTAVQEYQRNKDRTLWGYGENFPADGLIHLDNAPANQETGGNFYDWMNASYLGMMNYNYQGRYVVNLTMRREGSSRFAENKRFGTFWSAGLAWNVTEEGFMEGVDFLSNLKLRGSYGTSGNSSIGLNNYQPLLAFDAKYEEKGAFYPQQIGNTALTWEKNRNLDAGLDFGLFEGAVTGSFSYYNRETYDLIQNVPLSATTGFDNFTKNVGAMVNKGIEAELDWNIIRSEDFNWRIGGHFSTINNEVTELAQDPAGGNLNIQDYDQKTAVGHPVEGWFIRKWAGVDPETGEATWYLNGKDGETTTNYYEAEKNWQGGNHMPTYSGGFSTHLDYHGIYLDVNVMFSGGNKIRERWTEYYFNSGFYPIAVLQGVEGLMDRWQEPGDQTDVPKQVYGSDNSAEASSRFLHEGDFVRVKGITLGYNLPESLYSRVGLEGVRIYARASNYFTWVKDDNLKHDPEVRAAGVTRLTTPPTKSLTFGLNLNF